MLKRKRIAWTPWLVVGLIAIAPLAWLIRSELEHRKIQPSAVDIGFSQAMAVHHEQALLLASVLLDGPPGGLRPLAQSLATQQAIELGQFRGWLSLWQAPFKHDPSMNWMRTSNAPLDPSLLQYLARCAASPERMPGLASPAEIDRLRSLRGRERDILFLQLMQRHHEGGLPMARFAARAGQLRPVTRLAQQIMTTQAKEISQFDSMLAMLHATHTTQTSTLTRRSTR